MEEGADAQEVLVIGDSEGNRYLIRRETLEQGKVVGDQVEELNNMMERADSEVEGFSFGQPSFSLGSGFSRFNVVNTYSVKLAPAAGSFQISDALRQM